MLQLRKKLQTIMALMLLFLGVCGNLHKADGAQTTLQSLETLRKTAQKSNRFCAVAFLGYIDTPYKTFKEIFKAKKLTDKYPFLADIPAERFVELEGDELYCIVPLDKKASVTVNEYIYNDAYLGKAGKTLYRGDSGEPILVRGNLSDIAPNIQVVVAGKNGTLKYNPSVSLNDGSLNTPSEGVYDFSLRERFGLANMLLSPVEVLGSWITVAPVVDSDGYSIVCIIAFSADGSMFYGFGEPNSEFLATFEGKWRYTASGTVVFDMQSYKVDDETGEKLKDHEPDAFWGTFGIAPSPEGNTVFITHTSGSPLLYGADKKKFEFTRRD